MTNDTPEQPAVAAPMPAAPPAPPKRRLGPLAAGLVGLAVGAALVGGVWAITANNGSSGPGEFTLKGTFALLEDVSADGDGCEGRYDSGYDDISEGTAVTVYGASGEVVATGELGDSTQAGGSCLFDVAVPGVPKGEKFYKVEVSHRGTLQLSAKEAEGGEFAGTLG